MIEKQARRWTYEEYYRLEDDQRYEIIDGNLSPATLFRHVVLDSENTAQPDLIFVAAANIGIIEKRAIFGAPDLLVELLSPSSVRRDRQQKKAFYARFGVKECWIGDPANKTMEILTLRDGRYLRHCAASERGRLVSKVLPGLELDLADIQSLPNT